MLRLAFTIASACALSSCSGYEEEEGEPSGVITQSEREALDDAEEMLEQRRVPEDKLPTTGEPVETRDQTEIAE